MFTAWYLSSSGRAIDSSRQLDSFLFPREYSGWMLGVPGSYLLVRITGLSAGSEGGLGGRADEPVDEDFWKLLWMWDLLTKTKLP